MATAGSARTRSAPCSPHAEVRTRTDWAIAAAIAVPYLLLLAAGAYARL